MLYRITKLCGNACQQCRSIPCRFFCLENLDFMGIDISLDLTPKVGARSTSTQADVSHRHVHFFEERKCVFEAEGNAFQDRPSDVPAGVARGQAGESAARIRIDRKSVV